MTAPQDQDLPTQSSAFYCFHLDTPHVDQNPSLVFHKPYRMSFGFSLSDFIEVTKLSWRLYESLKDGPQDIKDLARDLTTVYNVLNHIQDDLGSRESAIKSHGEGRLDMFQMMTTRLRATLDEIQKLVDKFRPMAAESRAPEQLWIRVRYVARQKKIKRIHQDISFHISSFSLLMGSMAKCVKVVPLFSVSRQVYLKCAWVLSNMTRTRLLATLWMRSKKPQAMTRWNLSSPNPIHSLRKRPHRRILTP